MSVNVKKMKSVDRKNRAYKTFCCALAASVLFLGGCAAGPEVQVRGEPDEADRKIILEEKKQLAKLYLRLGDTYFLELKDYQRAKEYFTEYLQIASNGPGADLARKRLQQINGFLGVSAPAAKITEREDDRRKPSPGGLPKRDTPAPAPIAESADSGSLRKAPLRETDLVDHTGHAVPVLMTGKAVTIILFWKDMNVEMLNLLKELCQFAKNSIGRNYHVLAATQVTSTALPGYLKDKGVDCPLIFDEGGKLAAAIGADSLPTLAAFDGDGHLLELEKNWDGSGISKFIQQAKEKTGD